MPQPSPVARDPREQHYRTLRDGIFAMLHAEFPGVLDQEEIYQEAWAEVLECEARGVDISEPGGLLRTIAWRGARDRLRRASAHAVDPTSPFFARQADPGVPPEDQAQVRLDAAAVRHVVDSLDEQHAAVVKLRFDGNLSAREIQRALGLKPKRLESVVTEAYKLVQHALV